MNTDNTQPIMDPEPGHNPDIDYYNINKSAKILRALNHKRRQQLIETIHENKRLTVTQIYEKMKLEQSVASQHLAILRRAGIVFTERDGKFIFYRLNKERISEITRVVKLLTG